MSRVYLFLATGFEEVEAMVPTDFLRRAEIDVMLVAVEEDVAVASSLLVLGSHNILVQADIQISEVDIENADALIFPGGLPGSDNLAKNSYVSSLIRQQLEKKGIVAAICAAPARTLGIQGFLDGVTFTGYPGTEQFAPNATYKPNDSVVKDKNIITSQGVGTAAHFAYVLVQELKGQEIAQKLWDVCLLNFHSQYPSIS